VEKEMRSSTDQHTLRIQEYVRQRNKLLLKGNPDDLRQWMRERKIPVPRSKDEMLVVMHKSITAALSLPKEYRQRSKDWLSVRNLKSLDDGDLK
jgi:hypothetical protein